MCYDAALLVLGVFYTHLASESTAAGLPNMASELEQLRQEAEQLKVQIRVSIVSRCLPVE